MLVGMSRSGTQRLLGRSRQLLRIARTPVFPERDLEESLQRILAIARMQLTVQGGPYREAEHRQHSCQQGTAPSGGSAHATRLAHGEKRRKQVSRLESQTGEPGQIHSPRGKRCPDQRISFAPAR